MAEAWRRQGGGGATRHTRAESTSDHRTITLRTWEMGGDNTGAAELAFQQALAMCAPIFARRCADHQITLLCAISPTWRC